MPRDPHAARLIGGPYRPPQVRVGAPIRCLRAGEVIVAGFTDAPVRWPYWASNGGFRSVVLTGDLVTAVVLESEVAVCYHWGISRDVARKLRRALDVPRFNRGTRALWARDAVKLNRKPNDPP